MTAGENHDPRGDEPTEERARPDSVEDILRSDGGTTTETPFETTANVEETRSDRYKRTIEAYLLTPLTIVKHDVRAILAFGILSLYGLMALLAVFVVEPTQTFEGGRYVPPLQTWEHPLGTDKLGRDLFSQTVRSTIPLGKMMISGALFTIGVGTVVGVVSGYKGGIVDRVLSTITDVFINLPGLPLIIVLAVLFNPRNEFVLGILISIAAWAGLARAIRAQVLTLRQESFVEVARAMDIPTPKILYKEILPHLWPYIMVNGANAARAVIFAAVALYFLGILPYNEANWGTMLSEAYGESAYRHSRAYHWIYIPVGAITLLSVGLILLAQSLDRVFNPRVRARHAERAEIDPQEETQDTKSAVGFQQ